jgi:hypothetical protein
MRRELGQLLAVFALVACRPAVADDLTIDDAHVQYNYSYDKHGPIQLCNLATVALKDPIVVKLTSSFYIDERKAKDADLSMAYAVEAFVGNNPADAKQIRVLAGRIISDVFDTDLHAEKAIGSIIGAAYFIRSEGSRAPFVSVITRGNFTLVVEFENRPTMTFHVRPTPEILEPSQKWSKCSVDIAEHRSAQ